MGYLDNVVVFVIDDNPANLKVLNGFMKLLGWKVHIAQDGESGIEKILKVLPDICLLYTSPSPRDLSTSRMPSSA